MQHNAQENSYDKNRVKATVTAAAAAVETQKKAAIAMRTTLTAGPSTSNYTNDTTAMALAVNNSNSNHKSNNSNCSSNSNSNDYNDVDGDRVSTAAMGQQNQYEYEENVEHLRKLFNEHQLVSFKIAHIVCSAGSSSGDNYMSVVKRVSIYNADTTSTEMASSGAPRVNCTVIIKRQIASLSRRQLYRCEEAFANEIRAYRHMVPLLRRYSQQQLFPDCHIADTHDHSAQGEPIIVLQDLKALGYRMQNRLVGLELRHCLLVMKKLAQLHAASLAAEQLETTHFTQQCAHMQEIVYCPDAAELYSRILDTSVQQALDSLHNSNSDGSLTTPIQLIEQLQPQLFQQLQGSINAAAQSQMSVVCHGDLWVNNIMFKSQPEEAIFFDLQAMRRTSPVFDILHFIYTSTRRQLRDVHTDTLLAAYAEALAKELEQQLRHTSAADNLSSLCETFSLQRLSEEYVRCVHYGLAICMWILPAVTFDPHNLPNLDVISELNLSGKEIKCSQKLTPEYHARIRELALEFYEHGYLAAPMEYL